jgi:hypothetical protein
MRASLKHLGIILVVFSIAFAAGPAMGQGPCRGDVDDSGVITANDINATITVLFADELSIDPGTLMRADTNSDGAVAAADLTAVVRRQDVVCPPGPTRTSTPTRTGTATSTVSRTPTPSRTPLPTSTPTQVCTVQTAVLGTTNGALAQTDCRRTFLNNIRLADEYAFTAAAGQAVKVTITATGFAPYIRVIDSNGYFEEIGGESPVEFTATTSVPYTILVSSDPLQPLATGAYQMNITSRPCPTETLRTGIGSINGTECPDPGGGSVGARLDLADLYTFTIEQPLTGVEIIMEQSVEDSSLDPIISVYGPDGYEAFPVFQADDAAPGGFGFDAQARFVAAQTGTYTLVASGGGCNPADEDGCGYRLKYRNPGCPSVSLNPIPSTSRKVVAGTLFGDTRATTCPAPLTLPGFNELGEPDVNGAADVYTFTAVEGDVISAQMDSEG